MNCKNFGYKALFVSYRYGMIQVVYLGFAGDLLFCEDNIVYFNRIATCHLLHNSVALHSYVDLVKSYSSAAVHCSDRLDQRL